MGTMADLNDPLVVAFERCTLQPHEFHHREHLWVAWCYLHALPFEHALARFTVHVQRLAAHFGAPQKYHATITWVYLLELDAAMREHPELGFDALLERRPELGDKQLAARWYDADELASPAARVRFVLPRRARRSAA